MPKYKHYEKIILSFKYDNDIHSGLIRGCLVRVSAYTRSGGTKTNAYVRSVPEK